MTPPTSATAPRPPLTPARVITGAVELADDIGIDDLTIRRLADALDVKPMSIYHHLPNKDAIIDGMVDAVFAEIERPPADLDWRAAISIRARSARQVLAAHPWATPLMESRTDPGPATLGHHDAVLGCFRNAGFSLALTAHAYAALDALIYGFALQESSMPATTGQDMQDLVDGITARFGDGDYPHLAELTVDHVMGPGYDFGNEFEFALALLLDGLAAAAAAEQRR